MIARASAVFLRPVVNMLVVAGTFLALRGYIEDPGVRGAIAWTAGPLAIEVARALLRRRRTQGGLGGASIRDGEGAQDSGPRQ